jgi:hypothetical protein
VTTVRARSGGQWLIFYDDDFIDGLNTQLWDQAIIAPLVRFCPDDKWGIPGEIVRGRV